MDYWSDTIKDMILDMLGGASAAFIARFEMKLWRRK